VNPGTTRPENFGLCQSIDAVVPQARAMAMEEDIRNSQAYGIIHAIIWTTSLPS
jgi:hypothetical protein